MQTKEDSMLSTGTRLNYTRKMDFDYDLRNCCGWNSTLGQLLTQLLNHWVDLPLDVVVRGLDVDKEEVNKSAGESYQVEGFHIFRRKISLLKSSSCFYCGNFAGTPSIHDYYASNLVVVLMTHVESVYHITATFETHVLSCSHSPSWKVEHFVEGESVEVET